MKFPSPLAQWMRIVAFFAVCINLSASIAQFELKDLDWNLWLDTEAEWENDELYLPPVNLSEIPTNAPTCGWEDLERGKGKSIGIPATVEEHFWDRHGHSFGIAGDYVGVSWFTTEFKVPEKWEGKRIILKFESVRMRAEIYVNRELAGYDLINGTRFEVDATDFVKYGELNQLAVRITDPNGNFAWRDWETYKWGEYDISPSHGFGGITGPVTLEYTDSSVIDDVFIKNRPQANSIDVRVSLANKAEGSLKGEVEITVKDPTSLGPPKFSTTVPVNSDLSNFVLSERIEVEDAKLWTPDTPHLYEMSVKWVAENGDVDSWKDNFGFRWFDVVDVDGDKQFWLNGKRVFLLSAISWGHWPINGIYPTDELAKKHVTAAKELGLNCMNFHRGFGQESVLDYADTLGLMYYAEPGGYRPGETDFSKAFKRERLLRMVRQFRNHPSVVIYNMINESARDPFENEIEDIQLAHREDETRCITFTSTFIPNKPPYHRVLPTEPAPIKMHMLPYDHEVKNQGWWDSHHAGGPGTYLDNFYNSPTDFRWYTDNEAEIILWGEEGAIGTLPRLDTIKKEYEKAGNLGWDGDKYLNMQAAFAEFIEKKGFSEIFPTVESLTMATGEVSLYYQGRMIENKRAGNVTDGYMINGWEDTKIENHSGIVDIYRNPKGNASTLAYYSQPEYIAVKLRNKVLPVGEKTVADFYMIQQGDLEGKYNLAISIVTPNGTEKALHFAAVELEGGNTFGQLLVEGFEIPVEHTGRSIVKAALLGRGETLSEGRDEIFAVELSREGLEEPIAVSDLSGELQKILTDLEVDYVDYRTGNDEAEALQGGLSGDVLKVRKGEPPAESVMIVGGGEIQPGFYNTNFRLNDPMLDWVARGNTLIIVKDADIWAEYLNLKEAVHYAGHRVVGRNWFGGNYFVKEHPLFQGLPVDGVFDWEYQSVAKYQNRKRIGLRLDGEECVVGVYADHNPEVYTAVGVIPFGEGKIILSALDLVAAIQEEQPSNIVAKHILMNYLRYGFQK
ncbi:MAG: hypothetical protein MI748_19525 [Opitutales bacterium]|nr:hypothetical protein [Opitutales bacterium]